MEKTALLVIDPQVELLSPDNPGIHDLEGVVKRIVGVLERARAEGVPVFFVQHDDEPGSTMVRGLPGWEFHPDVKPLETEPVFSKTAADSFYGTGLLEALREQGATRVVVTGCKSEFCIDTTSRHATSLGFDVTLLTDCHTTDGNAHLTGEQVVLHTNATLDEFGNDDHEVTVVASTDFDFAKPGN